MATIQEPPTSSGQPQPQPQPQPTMSYQLPPTSSDGHENHQNKLPLRKASLRFLRRSKSSDRPLSERKLSTGKVHRTLKKPLPKEEEEARRLQASHQPPRLPFLDTSFQSRTFEQDLRDTRITHNMSIPPPPPIPSDDSPTATSKFDPYASREGSITHRGRYSYTSNAASGGINGPRKLRRRKDPTPYK